MNPVPYAAVVLAGGAARRLGGAVKPAIPVAGRPMVGRVLDAAGDAAFRVVVGPPDLPVPADVLLTREQPPEGGPVAGAAAGLAVVPLRLERVALLASDLPLLDAGAIAALRIALDAAPARDGVAVADVALYLDPDGHRQSLCGVWRSAALRSALALLATRRGKLAGASMRALLRDVHVLDVAWSGAGPPPWFDCDTDADLKRAEELANEHAPRMDRDGMQGIGP